MTRILQALLLAGLLLLPQHTPRAAVTPAVALTLTAGREQVPAAGSTSKDSVVTVAAPVQPSGRLALPVIGGRATWYRADGMIGAAGPMLRAYIGRHWRGSLIEVRSIVTGQRIVVRLTDWCLCAHGRRLVDLSDDAFMQLAPLSKGVIGVSILRVVRAVPDPPATDTE